MALNNKTLICGKEVSRRQFEIAYEVLESDYDEDLILIDREILIFELKKILNSDTYIYDNLNTLIKELDV